MMSYQFIYYGVEESLRLSQEYGEGESLEFVSNGQQEEVLVEFDSIVNTISQRFLRIIRRSGYIKNRFDQLKFLARLRLTLYRNSEVGDWESVYGEIISKIRWNKKIHVFLRLITDWELKQAFAEYSLNLVNEKYIRKLTDIRSRYQQIGPNEQLQDKLNSIMRQ